MDSTESRYIHAVQTNTAILFLKPGKAVRANDAGRYKAEAIDLNLVEFVSAIKEQEKKPQYAGMTFTERLVLAMAGIYQSKYNS